MLEEPVPIDVSPGVAMQIGFIVELLEYFARLVLIQDAQSPICFININASVIHVEVSHIVSEGLEL